MNTPFGQRMLRLYDVMIEVVMVCNVIQHLQVYSDEELLGV